MMDIIHSYSCGGQLDSNLFDGVIERPSDLSDYFKLVNLKYVDFSLSHKQVMLNWINRNAKKRTVYSELLSWVKLEDTIVSYSVCFGLLDIGKCEM